MINTSPGLRKFSVLIADDQEADRLFLREAIRRHAPNLQVVGEVADGEDVISYLWGYGEYADRTIHPLPDLLIMDVRMPRMSGIQVLEWLTTQNFPALKVAMLADSSSVEYGPKARELGLQHFYPKAIDTRGLAEVVKKLQAELEANRPGRYL
ncbi:MAG TPA: response regulator [Verrucomicrobiae bacterium]|jgi:DNA-binding NarL/FixJ family response regulator|nr:response regulator [Verrucomicrobiae bacterium]